MKSTSSSLPPETIEKFERARQNPLLFGEELLRIPEPPYGPFKSNYVQTRILTEESRTIWICCHRRSGKCLAGDTRILNPLTRRPTSIEQGKGFNKTLLFDFRTNRTTWVPCEWVESGEKPCIRFVLGTGIDITLSEDHEVFSRRIGWTQSRNVKVGDEILAPNLIDVSGGDIPTPDEISQHLDKTIRDNRFPDDIFSYRQDVLKYYIGLFFNEKGRILHSDRQIAFMLWNRELALDLHHLLLRIEVECRIDKDGNVFVDSDIDRAMFLRSIGIDHPVLEVRSPRRWERVVSKKYIGPRPVFDMSVEHTDHNFIGSDLVLHNSYGLSLVALWHAVCHNDRKVVLFVPSNTQVEEWFKILHTWIDQNPLLSFMKKTSSKNPNHSITFKNGSYIAGYIMGLNSNIEGSRRGITADIVFVDEAGEMSDSDWDVIIPIMRGDKSRRARMRSYVAGTLKEPSGEFWRKIEIVGPTKQSAVIKIPITENLDWTPEEIQEEFEEVGDLGRWQREYLLEVTGKDSSVFPKNDIEKSCQDDWEWGPENIDDREARFITVDWDKVQCGTNILVTQYNPHTRKLTAIYHEEVPRSEFHYIEACNRVLDLCLMFGPQMVVTDQGNGMMQYEYLIDKAQQRGISGILFEMVAFQKGIEVLNPQTMEVEKKQAKDFLVGRLQKKFQEDEIRFPNENGASVMRDQFYKFHIKKRLASGLCQYGNDSEHIVDCWFFACYALWMLYENDFQTLATEGDAHMNIPLENLLENDDQMEAERSFWSNLEGNRSEPTGVSIFRSGIEDGLSRRQSWEFF